MNASEIARIPAARAFPDPCESPPQLLETHISWVLLADRYAYKIKKPVCYDFLDFSTLSQRNYFCRREILLNARLTQGIYLEKIPVMQQGHNIRIGEGEGTVIDYAIRMRRMDAALQMDQMLREGRVTEQQLDGIAEVLAHFHQHTRTIEVQPPAGRFRKAFNDLAQLDPEALEAIPRELGTVIPFALNVSDAFLAEVDALLLMRSQQGYFRDCHGDLHSGNIFLYDPPVLFDCLEFNDELRITDILDEVAFLCMDLEWHGYPELSEHFMRAYLSWIPCMHTASEYLLFVWYKFYRANVRAKVLLLAGTQEGDPGPKRTAAIEHLRLMQHYAGILAGEFPAPYKPIFIEEDQ